METLFQPAHEVYFAPFRGNIVGINASIPTPYGIKPMIYADWTASGRLYGPIEDHMRDVVGPLVGNTHTETSYTGRMMTNWYKDAVETIRKHINAGSDDIVICAYSGMTGVVNKLQRMLGLRVHEQYRDRLLPAEKDRAVVFVTHMEHHSNQTSWLETLADVVIIPPDSKGLPDLDALDRLLLYYANRPVKIGAFTSCSNVTGILTPYHKMAALMHKHGGVCFVDFAASAPYIDINMHPENPDERLDAVYFSPHKCLGGPGSSGVLAFNRSLYRNTVPDISGGGTVDWTNPWGEHKYHDDIEAREDGGTPGFLQTMRTALALTLKNEMTTTRIQAREHQLLTTLWKAFKTIPGLHVLGGTALPRLGIVSFVISGLHYNLVAALLNDRFGIQVRSGCSCAGTYGHYLLNLTRELSEAIKTRVLGGDMSVKPGWVRLSLHPTMTDEELDFVIEAIRQIAENGMEWAKSYRYDPATNEFTCIA
jgi:selenocysteine lyase/cysteine desulfurase